MFYYILASYSIIRFIQNKHRQACKKLNTSKRKVFDSGRQRAAGSDVNYVKTKETKKIQIEGERPRVRRITKSKRFLKYSHLGLKFFRKHHREITGEKSMNSF